MRGDLQDRLQRTQSASDNDDKSQKLLLGGAAILMIAFIAAAVAFTAFIVKAIDKFMEPDTDSSSSSYSYSDYDYAGSYNTNSGSSSSGGIFGSLAQSQSQAAAQTQNFKYGTVDGTTYFSSFSGITFTAPSDWIMSPNSGTSSSLSSLYSPKDLSASSSDMSQSVIISYELMSMNSYETVDDALQPVIKIATTGLNNTLEKENISDNIGGNDFKGIIYKKTVGDTYSYYNEVLVSVVNGYALKIQLQANTESELVTIRGMFK